jgi:hypothetical protein
MATGDLTDIETVTAYLQTDPNVPLPANDLSTLLPRLITAASQFIRNYLNRNILNATYSEMQDGRGYVAYPTYLFRNYPVSSVQSVMVDGVVVPAAPPPTPGSTFRSGYMFDERRLVFYGVQVPRKPMCVVLQYTAGFNEVPSDIAEACVELVALRYRERKRVGLTSESVSGIGARAYSVKDLPDSTKLALQPYRTVAPL